MFGKESKKKELVNNLGDIYQKIEREHQISPGDFPSLRKMQASPGLGQDGTPPDPGRGADLAMTRLRGIRDSPRQPGGVVPGAPHPPSILGGREGGGRCWPHAGAGSEPRPRAVGGSHRSPVDVGIGGL